MRSGAKRVEYLQTGKLQSAYLRDLLGKIDIPDERVIIGPGIGDDAAVLDMGDHFLIVKSDPITFVQDRIGWYVVNINANDIAAMGGIPRWFLVTVLLPDKGTTTALIEEIMRDLRKSCEELGVSLIGGHTEVTRGLQHPILSGTMLGEVAKSGLVNNSGIGAGDLLYITRGVAIEATSIIAREKREQVVERFGEDFYARCLNFLQEPGISVLADARRILDSEIGASVTGMHDPTEGGVLMGGYEMAMKAGIGLSLEASRVPVYEETRVLCDFFGLSPLGLIASGALLVSVKRECARKVQSFFEEGELTRIGVFDTEGEGVYLREGRKARLLVPSARDEITKIFD
jgi:hydrogenase expression/formation protein HypE